MFYIRIFGGKIFIKNGTTRERGQLKSLVGRIKKGHVSAEIKNENNVDFIIFRSGNKEYKMDLTCREKEYLENLFKTNKKPKFVSFIDDCLFISF